MEFACPFCKGEGVDPYVEALPAPTCPVCLGAPLVSVEADPQGRYRVLDGELVLVQVEAGPVCEHVWDFAERDRLTTWNVCIRCGCGERWADGMLIESDDPAESARLNALAGERVRVLGALL
jgi:hypothetical protein